MSYLVTVHPTGMDKRNRKIYTNRVFNSPLLIYLTGNFGKEKGGFNILNEDSNMRSISIPLEFIFLKTFRQSEATVNYLRLCSAAKETTHLSTIASTSSGIRILTECTLVDHIPLFQIPCRKDFLILMHQHWSSTTNSVVESIFG
jgi:hypothetical protein